MYQKNMRQTILSKSSNTNETVNDSRFAGRHSKMTKERSDNLTVCLDIENGNNKSNKTKLNTDELRGKKTSISPEYSMLTLKKKENLNGKNFTSQELEIMSIFTSPAWSKKTANKPVVNVVANQNERRPSDYSNSNKSIDESGFDLHAEFSGYEMGYEYENYDTLQSNFREEQGFENISFTNNTYGDLYPDYEYADYIYETQESRQNYRSLDGYDYYEDVSYDDYSVENANLEPTTSHLLLYEKMVGCFNDTDEKGEIQKFELKKNIINSILTLILVVPNIFDALSVNSSTMAREICEQKRKFLFLYISNYKKMFITRTYSYEFDLDHNYMSEKQISDDKLAFDKAYKIIIEDINKKIGPLLVKGIWRISKKYRHDPFKCLGRWLLSHVDVEVKEKKKPHAARKIVFGDESTDINHFELFL